MEFDFLLFECDVGQLVYEACQSARHFDEMSSSLHKAQWRIAAEVLEQFVAQRGVALTRNFQVSLSRKRLNEIAPLDDVVGSFVDAKNEDEFWRLLIPAPPDNQKKQVKFLSDSRRVQAKIALETCKEFLRLADRTDLYQDGRKQYSSCLSINGFLFKRFFL